MCGFVGVLCADGATADQFSAVQAMSERLRHRGPDDDGSWHGRADEAVLGHRRLAILDLTSEGHQPMQSPSGRYVLAFNGEIYNFRELRAELESLGATFRGHSDTEVLLRGVEQWGLDATLRRSAGMFALALWDRGEGALQLARDRMGEKPLYYGWSGRSFIFGSELKALRAHPEWRGVIDRDVLALYLRHGYVPAPYSIYQGISKLAPGTILTLERAAPGTVPQPTPYWSVREAAEQGLAVPFEASDGAAVSELEAVLTRVIGEQMIADVPLGAFLSGGVDSSAIVALMQSMSSRPVRTFTIGFHESGYNEAEFAKAVAAHIGTDHTELYVTPEEARSVIPRLPSIYDEPFGDSSQIPTCLVAALARQQVTVALSGDGADELFGGYNRYVHAERLWNRAQRLPAFSRRALAGALRSVKSTGWDAFFRGAGHVVPAARRVPQPGDRVHKLARLLGVSSAAEMYTEFFSLWSDPSMAVPGARERETIVDDQSRWPELDSHVLRAMFLDQVTYLPDDILVKVDRATMAVSLESRAPFLDHRVVELAWRLPLHRKVRGGQGKWALREVLYRHVPRELIERPKMGFAVPVDRWLRGPLRDWAEELLDGGRLAGEGYFAPEVIRRKWHEHLSGAQNWSAQLWPVLMFQAWLDEETSQSLSGPTIAAGIPAGATTRTG